MTKTLDMLAVLLVVLFFLQLQWHPLPERAFQVLAGLVVAAYLWVLVAGYRRHPQGESAEPQGSGRWVLVGALTLFVLYVALRFMWAAAG